MNDFGVGSRNVKGYNTLTYSVHQFDKHLQQTAAALRERITEHYATERKTPPVGLTRMTKADLAAIMAYLDSTVSFQNLQHAAEKASAAMDTFRVKTKAVTVEAWCRCGQLRPLLDNGTFKRHTRFLHESGWSIDPTRVRCMGSGQFPSSVEKMRSETNIRDRIALRPLTYKHIEAAPHARGKKPTGPQSRRARRVGTKNAHRANYGKRFQVKAA